MLLNLLLLVLTSVAAVGGSVNVMENYEEHPGDVLEEEEEEQPKEQPEEFNQYVKKEKFENVNASMNANASVNNANASMNNTNASMNNVMESFQVNASPINNVSNASPVNNVSNASTVEGFTGGSFAAF